MSLPKEAVRQRMTALLLAALTGKICAGDPAGAALPTAKVLEVAVAREGPEFKGLLQCLATQPVPVTAPTSNSYHLRAQRILERLGWPLDSDACAKLSGRP